LISSAVGATKREEETADAITKANRNTNPFR
jgi:hypothetical protein